MADCQGVTDPRRKIPAKAVGRFVVNLAMRFPKAWAVWVGLAVGLGAVCRGAPSLPKPDMTFLDNGEVRVGMDLALGAP